MDSEYAACAFTFKYCSFPVTEIAVSCFSLPLLACVVFQLRNRSPSRRLQIIRALAACGLLSWLLSALVMRTESAALVAVFLNAFMICLFSTSLQWLKHTIRVCFVTIRLFRRYPKWVDRFCICVHAINFVALPIFTSFNIFSGNCTWRDLLIAYTVVQFFVIAVPLLVTNYVLTRAVRVHMRRVEKQLGLKTPHREHDEIHTGLKKIRFISFLFVFALVAGLVRSMCELTGGCSTTADAHCAIGSAFFEALIPALPFALALWHTNVEKSSTHVGSVSMLSSQASVGGTGNSLFHRRGPSSASNAGVGSGLGVHTLSSSMYPESLGNSMYDLYLNNAQGTGASIGRSFTPPIRPSDAPYGTLGRSISRSNYFATYAPGSAGSTKRHNAPPHIQMSPVSSASPRRRPVLRRTKSATDVRTDPNSSMNLRQFRDRVFELQRFATSSALPAATLASVSATTSTISPLPLPRREGSNFSHSPPILPISSIPSGSKHTLSRGARSVTSSRSTSNTRNSNTRSPDGAHRNKGKPYAASSPLKRASSNSSLSISAFSYHSNTKSEACSTTTTATVSPRTSWMSPVLGPLLQRNNSRRVRIMHANHAVYRDSQNSSLSSGGRSNFLQSIRQSHSARNLFSAASRSSTPPHHTWSLRHSRLDNHNHNHKRSHTAHIEFERSLSRNRPTTPTMPPFSHPTHIKVPTSLGTLRLPYDPLISRTASHSRSRNNSNTTPDRDFSVSQSVTKSAARSVTLTSPSTSGASYAAGMAPHLVERTYRAPRGATSASMMASAPMVEDCENANDFYAHLGGVRTRERAVTEPLSLVRSRSVSSVSVSVATPSRSCARSRSSTALDGSPPTSGGHVTPYERSTTLTVPGHVPFNPKLRSRDESRGTSPDTSETRIEVVLVD